MSWLLFQLVDSALPVGAFAHSSGLEAAWQRGEVRDLASLRAFCDALVWQTARSSLPFVNAAHRRPSEAKSIDQACDAFLSQHIANRASRTQGEVFIGTCARAFASPALDQLRERSQTEAWPRHLAVMFGLALRTLGANEGQAREAFMYTTLRGVLSAAVRLGAIGPYAAQKWQNELGTPCALALRAAAAWDEEDAAQTAPLLDVWQAGHDQLYSRLFQS